LDGYSIHLVFNDGRSRIADLEQRVFDGGAQESEGAYGQTPFRVSRKMATLRSKLRDKENFRDFRVEHSTLVWSGELDLAAEYLFYITFMDDPDLQGQFKE